ncbi:MAG: hypothetical protein GKS06_14720 [Acidobacteria bacterium]|nr:hypothetical protein [Acidobacteriota bacterium]
MNRPSVPVNGFRFVLVALGVCAALTVHAFSAAPVAPWRTTAAAALPDSGLIHLGLFNSGEPDGFMRLGWHKRGDAIELFDRTMMPSLEIYETMEIELSAADLAPRTMAIRFHQGLTKMATDVTFEASRAVGTRSLATPGAAVDSRPVDIALTSGTLARAVSFILPLLMGDSIPANLEYVWYGLPGLQTVSLRAAGVATVDTPAGTFETTRYELRGGSPENDIYVSTGPTPRVVRIDVLNEPLQFLAMAAPEANGANEISGSEMPDTSNVAELATREIAPHPDIAEMQRLIGDWHLATTYVVDGMATEGPAGFVQFRPALNGQALIKTGYHPSPGGAAPVFSSATTFSYAPHTEAVVASSNNSLGNRKTLTGTRTDDGFGFVQEGRLFGGRPGHNEIRYVIRSNDSYEVRQSYCPDGPDSCVESYRATGTRLN